MGGAEGFGLQESPICKSKSFSVNRSPPPPPHPHFFSQILTSGTGELGAESQLLKISLKITSSDTSASVVWES